MDNLTNIFLILTSIIIGFVICIILGIKSYLLIAPVVLVMYMAIIWYYRRYYEFNQSINPTINTTINPTSNSGKLSNNLPTESQSIITNPAMPSFAIATMFADGTISAPTLEPTPTPTLQSKAIINSIPTSNNTTNTMNISTKSTGAPLASPISITVPSIVESPQNSNKIDGKAMPDVMNNDKPPFDGLAPAELLSRLNYIYYATANPHKPVNYSDFKTHADKYLDEDGTKLSVSDPKLQQFARAFYPQLTADQIDARDCLNDGSGSRSCFQSKYLFYNSEISKNFEKILDKGVNVDNANLVVREDFSMPQILDPVQRAYNNPVMFMNAPPGNLDTPLDTISNEHIKLMDPAMDICHNCKLAVCQDDYCSLQNKLFM